MNDAAPNPREDQRVYLVRHGATEWSVAHRHTGRTDVPLTEDGRRQAKAVGAALAGMHFAQVFTSPLSRALESWRLAGLADGAVVTEDLAEWDYGDYEGMRTADIRASRPGWTLWDDGARGGETAADVAARVDSVIDRVRRASGDIALFAHAHVLRVLTARWLGLVPQAGRHFVLATGAISVLGYERETSALVSWNTTGHLEAGGST